MSRAKEFIQEARKNVHPDQMSIFDIPAQQPVSKPKPKVSSSDKFSVKYFDNAYGTEDLENDMVDPKLVPKYNDLLRKLLKDRRSDKSDQIINTIIDISYKKLANEVKAFNQIHNVLKREFKNASSGRRALSDASLSSTIRAWTNVAYRQFGLNRLSAFLEPFAKKAEMSYDNYKDGNKRFVTLHGEEILAKILMLKQAYKQENINILKGLINSIFGR
jgi:hypothetical protein